LDATAAVLRAGAADPYDHTACHGLAGAGRILGRVADGAGAAQSGPLCPDHRHLRLLLRALRIVDRAIAARLEGAVDRTTNSLRRAPDNVVHDAIVSDVGMGRADGGGDRRMAKG